MTETRMSNAKIVEILKEVLAAMEIKNLNRFRIRSYQNAIAIIDSLTTSIYDLWEDNRLSEIPGIGDTLSRHLNDLFTRGLVGEWEAVKKDLPEGMFALIGIRGIGAKKAFKLAMAFKLNNRATAVEELKKHAQAGEIQVLEGFGAKSEKDILEALDQQKMNKNGKKRMLLYKAEEIINRIYAWLERCPDVEKIEALGSYRRRNPTVGDIDIVVATVKPLSVIEHFIAFPEVREVVVKGDLKAIVMLSNDMQVDLRVTLPKAFGAMVQYNTGSKQHNIVLRTYALEKHLSLSEYGIKHNDTLEEFDDEKKFYARLGLPWIPPELRNGTNEVDLARRDKLPFLVSLSDIKGDLHTHTIASDGVNTLEEMVAAAKELGYKYIGLTDHSPSVISRGYDEVERLVRKQRDLVDGINRKMEDFKIYLGMEVNILADATLGLPDEILALLDYSIGSIHTSFNQNRDEITNRYIKAIENEYITIIGHPTGRLINERDAMDVDWRKVFDALLENNKIAEINAQPDRLDLTDDLARTAKDRGIPLIINSDAHATNQLLNLKYGIDVARRAFCERQNIINTLEREEFEKYLLRS